GDFWLSWKDSAWGIFISERKPGWKYLMQLFAVCSTVGFLSSVLFFLGIKFSLAHWPLDPLLISGFIWITFSVALCYSKHLRCFSILFILSCGLREGRNALIAAGTGVVVAGNIQSIFHNLKVLADSITCHLEVEQFTLIKHYIEAMKWIFQMAKFSTELSKDIVSLSHKFMPSYSISDDTLKQELNNTKQEIQKVANQISFMLTVLPCIGKRVLPIIGIFLVPLGTGLFIKKFIGSHTVKFKNTYITKQFVAFDEYQRQQKKPCVLPLNRNERKDYVTIPSFSLTWKDGKNMCRFLLPVIIHLCIWFLFSAIDYLLYWLIISVNNHLQELPDQEIGLILFQQLIVKNDTFKISLFKHDCIPKPELYLSATWIQLGTIIIFLIFLGLFSGVLTQFKILVSTSFYPNTEMKRVFYLHEKLLKKRAKLQQKTVIIFLSFQVNFWFPILKATMAVRKKERNVITDNTV
uniref:Dendrocyte expressed seven transmembrane protein n=1 Tax=Nothoprocta perdicaria TaxID=30464 RepID=A0A8C7A334_NOTPE